MGVSVPFSIRHTPYAIPAYLIVGIVLGMISASEGATRIALLPFQNVSGHVRSPGIIVPILARVLQERGYEVVTPERLDPFLFRQRIRATSKLSREQLRAMGKEFATPLALLGSIDLFSEAPANPQWGVSARLLATETGRILWADAAGFTGDDFTGFLGLGTVTSPEELASRAVAALFRELPAGDRPPVEPGLPQGARARKGARSVFRDARLDSDPPRRVAVLPFENGTERRGAALIVDDLFMASLFRLGRFEVIDPGDVYQSLQALGAAPYGAIDLETLNKVAERTRADAVILGRVGDYNEGLRPGRSSSPSVALDARMLDGRTGQILWMGYHEAQGEDFQIVLEFGKIKSIVPLAMRVIAELAATM